MLSFFNSKDGKIASRSIEEIKKNFSVDWIFYENKEVDIAIIPFGLDTQKDDVMTIPDNMFIPTERLFELYDVFFLSYQPGIEPQKGISIGSDELGGKFIGIIGEYIPYQEIAISTQTGRPRVIFKENTGLSRVWSVPFIEEILNLNIFKEQLNKLVKK